MAEATARSGVTVDEERAMAEPGDLEPELRRRVIALHRDIERLDFYELLAVDSKADRKAVKRAYYDLAAQFHPDRYFRKTLGSFKGRMEAIFARLTIAHDTLTGKETRAEYDAYLEEQRRMRRIEALLAEGAAEAKRAEEGVESAVRAQEAAESVAPAASAPVSTTPRSAGPSPKGPPPKVDAAARRDALARRLLGGRGPANKAPPTAAPPLTASEAVEALKRRYDEKVARAKANEARKYVAKADDAYVSGDFVAAANALRVASGLSPKDTDLEERAKDAQAKADQTLGDMYARQALYEEKNNQFAEAARSWARVCKVRPNDASAHVHAATALVKAGGDLHEAGRLAKRACELHPESAAAHAALGTVYLEVGHVHSARRELETAAQLAPHDDTIAALLKRAGKPI